VSFLRPDHNFLIQALRHPSTAVLLFNNLEPLVSDPKTLVTATYSDVKPIIGEDPFRDTEEELIKQYNSEQYLPQIIFLGLDERKGKEGFVYKEHYKGQPWFAVDVTPKSHVKEEAEKLIEGMKAKGLDFSKGRMNLSLPAQDGMFSAVHDFGVILTLNKLPYTPKPATFSTGTLETPSAHPAATLLSP
jgi:NAD+ diphosphatase